MVFSKKTGFLWTDEKLIYASPNCLIVYLGWATQAHLQHDNNFEVKFQWSNFTPTMGTYYVAVVVTLQKAKLQENANKRVIGMKIYKKKKKV